MNEITKKNILLAEDSTVTQDIVKLVLSQRGHSVDIAKDGNEALNCLLSGSYDLALIDFHLPVMTGVEAVRDFLAQREGEMVPRIVALTGDTQGLLEADGGAEYFEMVISKPFKIDEIVPIIEDVESKPRKYESHKNQAMAEGTSIAIDEPMPYDDLDLYLIYFPRDFYSSFKNAVSMRLSSQGAPDALIITTVPEPAQLEMIANLQKTHASPIVDLTGTLGRRADLSVGDHMPGEHTLRELIVRFEENRLRIHNDFEQPEDAEETLLTRIFANGSKLDACYDGQTRAGVAYQTIMNPDVVIETAARLKQRNLLKGEFFDRFQICPQCQSGRVLAREECPKCRSSQLREEYYLHHYRCAWQGPESDFKVGEDLICPKCRYELTHFGKDYDKPGSMLICEDCSHISNDPNIGFICLDCDAHTDSDQMIIRDVENYTLTEQGLELLESGRVVLGETRRSFRFSDLPIEMIIDLNTMAREYLEKQRPFSMVSIGYKNLRALERERGIRACDQSREMLRNLLRENIPHENTSAAGTAYDYLLVKDVEKSEIEGIVHQQLPQLIDQLSVSLDAVATVFGANELGG